MNRVSVPRRLPGSASAVLRTLRGPLRILVPVVILVVLARRVGAGPFEAAFGATSPALLAAAVVVTAAARLGLRRARHWIEPIGRPEVPTLPEVMRTASSELLKRAWIGLAMFTLVRELLCWI